MHPIAEFFTLVDSLENLSTRWEGALKMHTRNSSNLAAKNAKMLRRMYERCLNNADFRIDVLDYANELGNGSNDTPAASGIAPSAVREDETDVAHSHKIGNVRRLAKNKRSHAQVQDGEEALEGGRMIDRRVRSRQRKTDTAGVELRSSTQEMHTPLSIDTAPVHMPVNEGPYIVMDEVEIPVPGGAGVLSDDFGYISQMFFDQQFLDRDRVISYDEGMFAANVDWLGSGT
jgi:hypothetical protein